MRQLTHLFRHRRRSLVLTIAAMVAALGGGTAVGVLTSASSSVAAPAPPVTAPTATTAPATSAPKSGRPKAGHRVRGTVTAAGPTSLTLRTPAGRSVTVAVTPATRFGPGLTAGTVAVGDNVVVAGIRSAGKWTATRVRLAVRPPTVSPPTVPPTTGQPAA